MHDTALEIGRAAIEVYARIPSPRILEIGAMDVNGSLRQFAPSGSIYTGIDCEAGPSVDVVVEVGKPLPFPDESFDFVIASSVFEHDPAFWVTFVELGRKLVVGGFMYVSAPSNGAVHRYPEDNWRFYPDSGLALERWAKSQSLQLSLVESFTADRKTDIWNDFVAVFVKGEGRPVLPGQLLADKFDGVNIRGMGIAGIKNERANTQDMELLSQALRTVSEVEEANGLLRSDVESLIFDRDDLQNKVNSGMIREDDLLKIHQNLSSDIKSLENSLVSAGEARADLELSFALLGEEKLKLEASLSFLSDEKENMLRDLEKAKFDRIALEEVRHSLKFADDRYAEVEGRFAEQSAEMASLANLLSDAERSRDRFMAASKQSDELEGRIAEQYRELASMTELLADSERNQDHQTAILEWAVTTSQALLAEPFWWKLLPSAWRKRQRNARLLRKGLFDADAYLILYPDVAAAGIDPVQHFMLHGRFEGRKLTQ